MWWATARTKWVVLGCSAMKREISGCAAMNRVKPGCAWYNPAGPATFVYRLGVCCMDSEPVIFPFGVAAGHP